jgi:hypothetical protein
VTDGDETRAHAKWQRLGGAGDRVGRRLARVVHLAAKRRERRIREEGARDRRQRVVEGLHVRP